MTHDELIQTLQSLEQKIDELNQQKRQAIENYKSSSGWLPGTKVIYEGQVYFIYSSVYQHGFKDMWLTLTKLTKDNKFPKKPIQVHYTCASNCKLTGDNTNV